MFKTIPQNIAAKQAIADHLSAHDTADYETLSRLAGGDVQKEKRHILHAALKMLLSNSKVFACEHGKGYRRLSDSEVASSIGHQAICRIRNVSKRAQRKLATVDIAKLTNSEKIAHHTSTSMLGAVTLMAKHVKRIEAAVSVVQEGINPGRLYELFGATDQGKLADKR